jgi:hypothetical protein
MKNEIIEGQSFDFESKVLIPESVLFRELDGESVLLNLDNEIYYSLDAVGTEFLATLQSSESIETAHARLLNEYDVDSGRLQADLFEFVKELLEHNLLSVSRM